ncbi:MAG: hypothetical protein Q8O94_03085 [bacterium]|nr:hypothetical protein [bacterium]
MLIDIDINRAAHVGTGLFVIANQNFASHISDDDLKNEYPEVVGVNSYGVCDSPEQFMEHAGELLLKDPRRFVVGFTMVKKSEQPRNNGWRWRKWGPYIGSQKPTSEYLADEKDICDVYCYQVCEVRA